MRWGINRTNRERARIAPQLRRGVAGVAAGVMGLCALAACGDGAGAGQASAGGTGEASGTVTWWGWTPDKLVADRLIAQFNTVYPDITVNFKNFNSYEYKAALMPALSSNDGPDVFNMAAGGDTAGIQMFGDFAMDLTDLGRATLGEGWADQVNSTYLGQLTREDGSVAALPYAGVAAGFAWVNMDILAQRGLTYPKTYDEWVDVCQALAADDIACLTFGAARGDTTIIEVARPVANTIDPDYFINAVDGKRDWNDPVWVETLTQLKKMLDDGIITPDVLGIFTYPDSNNAFMSGQALMIATGTWYAQYALQASAMAALEAAGVTGAEPFTMLPQSYPDVAGKGNDPHWFGEVDYGLAINKKSSNVDAAQKLVSWLTLAQEGAQLVVNGLDVVPVLEGMEPTWETLTLVDPEVQQPAIAEMFTQAAGVTEIRQARMDADMQNELFNCITSVLGGLATPQEAAATLQGALNG